MREIEFSDIASHLGTRFGPTPWHLVDQSLIDRFAEDTHDLAWYHIDVARAREELPEGRTIAHGFLTMSLIPGLSDQVLRLRYRTRALNYGAERVRFPRPVLAGDRVRVTTTPAKLEAHRLGTLLHLHHMVESDRYSDGPAVVMTRLSLVLDEVVA